MEDILSKLEQEEITAYKRELHQYLDEIPDEMFYQYFGIFPMTEGEYDRICQDLAGRKYYCLLARFLERRSRGRKPEEEASRVKETVEKNDALC